MNSDFKNYTIVSDSSCDLTDEIVLSNNIKIIPFFISYDGKTYLKEREELDIPSMYEKLVRESNVFPKTAMPSVDDYVKCFTKELENNNDIICICVSTKFSGSYNSALSAKQICLETYPNARIEIIDSILITGLQGLFVLEIVRMKKDGLTLDDIMEKVDELKKSGRIYFTIGGLEYLIHGGRIGKLAGMVGASLKIKPIIVLKEGELFSEGISFTRKKAALKAISLAKEYFKKTKEDLNEYQLIVGYGYNKIEGENFYNKVCAEFNCTNIPLIQIGATIGVHTGPHPLGIGLIKKYEYIKK